MKPKPIIKEIILLVSVFLIIWLIAFCITGTIKLNREFSINLHDTYFVIAWSRLIVVPYLFIVSVIYLVREAFFKYNRRLQNIMLLVTLLLIIVILLGIDSFISTLAPQTSGWTIYPPLSALPQQNVQPAPLITATLQILFYLQIFFILLLVIVAILTGKNWKSINEKT
jgi:heme/copper-type cytochrome/quinol oxidase subunit 1